MKFRVRMLAATALAALAVGFVPVDGRMGVAVASAQNLGQRVVGGTVLNDASAPVAGATVFLRNTKSKSIRSYTSTRDGRFRFAQVNMADDFDLWAEKDGKKSANKTVSSWDTRKEVESELRLK